MAERDCTTNCGPDCAWIFDRVRVLPTIQHGTRVEWTLHPQFTDPGPYTFQLQTGRTGSNLADDWTNVGTSVEDTFYLLDDEQRVYGKTQWTHYRIVLTTPLATYTSASQHTLGDLAPSHFRRLREVLRMESLMLRKESGQEGYLLKRKLYGEPCPENCRDYLTNEITNPNCESCLGTGFINGYFDPIPCVYAELKLKVRREHLDAGQVRGSINDIVVPARMLAVPQLNEEDVWVDKDTDHRWYIHQIKHAVEIQGVPVVYDPVELRLAPFSDIIYQIAIADQLPE